MAKTEGEPLLESDQEEIALSDSELDNVLKSADITDAASGDDGNELEQYGVWVKVEPQNIEEEAGEDMSFELSDLDNSGESALTEEEEQLLGELEEDEDNDLGDLSGLEDDLEQLGKGNAFEEQEGEEDISVEDLDVDLEEIGESALEEGGDLDSLAEMEAEEELSLELEPDAEIEVPLSDSAIVEEHYEDLATVESVPSTPGEQPAKGSSDVLEKIERDLNQIKMEIQNLKSELAGLSRGGPSAGKVDVAPAPSGSEGFFEKGEDETIALTGDELDNILNTADVTEEVEPLEEVLESPDMEELAEPELEELEEEAAIPAAADEEIMELGSLDLEETPAEEISMGESAPAAAEEQPIEIDIGEKDVVEELSLEEEGDELEGFSLEEIEEPEELSLDEAAEELSVEGAADAVDLEELDALELEEPGLEEATATEELSLEEPIETPPAEEPGSEQPGLEAVQESEELEELSLDETGPDDTGGGIDELSLEEMPEAEDGGEAEDVLALDELEELPPESLDTEDLEVPGEELEVSAPQAAEALSATEGMSEDLKTEIKSVLSYFDQLLEALPEEKIKEFAQSEYFVRYQRLFKELGLGA